MNNHPPDPARSYRIAALVCRGTGLVLCLFWLKEGLTAGQGQGSTWVAPFAIIFTVLGVLLSLAAKKKMMYGDSSERIFENPGAARGEGSDESTAVVIQAGNTFEGIAAENKWLEKNFGERGKGWTKGDQSCRSSESGRMYDVIEIELADGTRREVIFDITSFFGKL